MIIRQAILANLMILGAIALLIYPHSAAAVSLRSHAMIDGNTIMLSDVFSGLPAGKDKALGPAPRPGKDMVLNARTLMRIAIALNLSWRPDHAGEQVVLSRAATVINAAMIEDALMQEMTHKGVSGRYQLAFNGPLSEMVLPLDMPASVEVQSINIRAGQDRFDAQLVAPSKADPVRSVSVSGAIHRLVDVPVLRDTIRNGSVIGKRDIDSITMREVDLGRDTILDEAAIIGMTPRRISFQGKPLKDSELEAPLIVGRGDFVTVTFAHKGMRLTAQGRALENGAKGDIIRITNASTNKNLDALVTGQREVEVREF